MKWYSSIFAPVSSTYEVFILISFLNINLGVEACFYDGMTALARTGLQLVFPAYLFLLMGIITVLARSKYRCSKCFSHQGCLSQSLLYLLFRAFGAKVMNMKQLMKALPGMFEHSDKNVRGEV